MLSYKGSVGQWYCSAAKRSGIPCVNFDDIERGFRESYKETSEKYPCFGGSTMTSKEWWKICVKRSFELAGQAVPSHKFERLFQRIYSLFGSPRIYEAFDDVTPFLNWAKRRGIVVGVVSNSDERYVDGVLPMLDIAHDLDFMIVSKKVGCEKPEPDIFKAALKSARQFPGLQDLRPEQVLHIGDNYIKDYCGAKDFGCHGLLMNRYDDFDLDDSKAKSVPVVHDFLEVVESISYAKYHGGRFVK
eukprot:CAMPEP_0185254366 /NCGR_PEP_ID=MMETSP1359-20130426/3136_1 /TAXON_ID=552665 /ORGANISM="Bigelowiella longifila, Strain CCMP242" /LENGTH=244 /DNA_ID=CAMNT_0027837313 /DNA_START=167 /DNA_END=901 /DNA_ORIENTATION=-